jgi:hypothetical protein
MTQGRIELEGSPEEVADAVKDIYLRTGRAGSARTGSAAAGGAQPEDRPQPKGETI